ncbi:FAD binding domain-containing protein [Hirsutella rhossiliensis]|uniref:FAD binding domain-containing protein n=1 Tax=Hirsutella rhossiliensis TaxID=111463 RepID=A0A9P8MZV0_9HYPO|nr:FAD binding domain-containing protein [Hirsutella rhossiliensis]KAH0964322.1 FAD binding domain-containing protein [Hirsutella rhossiliensis]
MMDNGTAASRGANGGSPARGAGVGGGEPGPGIDTEFLIVGSGPAGASLACFLASYGLKGIVIASTPGTADTPRAHITNMAAMECLRDIGLERDMDQVSSKASCMVHTRWCYSMAGDEFARLYSWGNDPRRKGDYEMASPCKPADLPQTLLEPILIRHAVHHGFRVRFDTTLLSFADDERSNVITAVVRDDLTKTETTIRTTYLFGADGARSHVVQRLGLPLDRKPGQGLAFNVLVKADMSHLIGSRMGNLHWVMQPDREHPDFGCMGVVRMIKPWDEWLFILLPGAEHVHVQPSREELLQRVREFIGDETPAEILDVSKWQINEVVADRYSEGNVFCLGDAVHRHPPMNGLGSNTCIQDAYNLAWKIAYVHRGLAGPSLLSTYSEERQPVGKTVVERANQAFRDHFDLWESLGTLEPDLDERRRVYGELLEPGARGSKRRQDFRRGIQKTIEEFHGLGVEMGQHYGGRAIHDADEPAPFQPSGRAAENAVLYHEPNTYPGSRLPHVWLNKAKPTTPTSTIDIAGHGRFVLLTGCGGEAWKRAAGGVSAALGVPLEAHSIGFRQDWEDFYFEWERLRGVQESGAVLVRPDRFVAWRADDVVGDADACAAKLGQVMRSILCLQQG